MSRVLGIDVETTGLLVAEDRITEIGAVLYDWSTGIPLQVYSTLVLPEKTIPEEVVKLNGITNEMVEEFGIIEEDAIVQVQCMVDVADYVMAHNAPFDKGFLGAGFARRGITMPEKVWLCSLSDIKYPAEITTRNLTYLAAEKGIINPFRHRAVFDVLTMLKVAGQFELDEIVKRSQEPTVYVQAHVSFDEKELAKEQMFQWCGPKKVWWKALKSSDYREECEGYAFRHSVLKEKPE